MKKSVLTSLLILFVACISGVGSALADSGSSAKTQGDPDDIYWDDRFDALGVSGTVLSLTYSGTDLIVGGDFTMAGPLSANNIAKWDGSAWAVIGNPSNGTDGAVNALAINGSDIIAAGTFSSAGGVAVNNIAKWNGNAWAALGSGLANADIQTATVDNGNVYVGGIFSSAGGQTANNIAVWDGESWSALLAGTANGVNGPVFALAVNGGSIFVAGSFTTAGEQSASNIAAWNTVTQSWSALGSGVNLDVLALATINDDLFVAGIFTTAGGNTARKIARWDGTQWSPLGEGITSGNVVEVLKTVGNDLFVGGNFTTVGNSVAANNIAQWNGSTWSKLGSGITGGPVFALEANTSELYAGGSFSTAGGKPSKAIARWNANGSVPVELSLFSGRVIDDLVELSWTTTTEENNFGFDVEKMIINDRQHWQTIGFVPGFGTSTAPHSYSFKDQIRPQVQSIRYRLKQIDLDGSFTYSDIIEVHTGLVPETITLNQNYPNPFNPATTIEFFLPEAEHTTLKIYDVLGREISTLVNRNLQAGIHQVLFSGERLPSGVYYYVLHLRESNVVKRKRMVLLK